MSKCAALIKIGWLKNVFEGDGPCGVINKLEEIQDFGCLMEMGRAQEGPAGQKELDKLEAFLEKYYDGSLTMKDIRELDVDLSIGKIICYGTAETEAEIEALKAGER